MDRHEGFVIQLQPVQFVRQMGQIADVGKLRADPRLHKVGFDNGFGGRDVRHEHVVRMNMAANPVQLDNLLSVLQNILFANRHDFRRSDLFRLRLIDGAGRTQRTFEEFG